MALNQQIWLAILLLIMPLSALTQNTVLAPLYQTPMNWTDDQGKSLSLAKWQGKPVIITMAYSTCRKICPLTLARLTMLQREYDKRKIDAEFIIISYDPLGDTWQSWEHYRKAHELHRGNWHFLIGSPEDTKRVSQLLGMDYWLYDEHVMHDFNIALLGPQGQIEKTIDWDHMDQVKTLMPAVYTP